MTNPNPSVVLDLYYSPDFYEPGSDAERGLIAVIERWRSADEARAFLPTVFRNAWAPTIIPPLQWALVAGYARVLDQWLIDALVQEPGVGPWVATNRHLTFEQILALARWTFDRTTEAREGDRLHTLAALVRHHATVLPERLWTAIREQGIALLEFVPSSTRRGRGMPFLAALAASPRTDADTLTELLNIAVDWESPTIASAVAKNPHASVAHWRRIFEVDAFVPVYPDLVTIPAIRADPQFRQRLRERGGSYVLFSLVEDEPRATLPALFERLERISAEAVVELLAHEPFLRRPDLESIDLLPLLRSKHRQIRLAASAALASLSPKTPGDTTSGSVAPLATATPSPTAAPSTPHRARGREPHHTPTPCPPGARRSAGRTTRTSRRGRTA